jgi:hypothetical protein
MVSTFPARERAGFEQGIGERGIGQGPTRIDAALRAQNARDAAPRWRGGRERACDGGGCERACGGGREGACSDWRALKPSGAIILKIPNNAADDGKPHRPESISNVLQRFELDLERHWITMRAAHATGTDRSASPRDAC